ncbi:hypothetical protein [Roseospira visakhapatnamensis]|uniref:Uncharacterized protein n=1 Tax=Roseospira visakhapatnamensis TaxID=390880 RepID=A0A7W6WAV8_9PROT|nr:hypothetical protein [Roseospira visakhapatnamensis]MBB4267605.1 hypothetical protein [Roseospira visakhapatnamensis]
MSGITCPSAYRAAKKAQADRRIQDATRAAPRIHRLRKDGTPSKAPLEQRYHHWTTVAEAEQVCRRMEEMNPGTTWVVITD